MMDDIESLIREKIGCQEDEYDNDTHEDHLRVIDYDGTETIIVDFTKKNEEENLNQAIAKYKENIEFEFILIFKEYSEMRRIIDMSKVSKKLKKQFMNKAYVLYKNNKVIEFKLDNVGENYLEYLDDPHIKSKVYSISIENLLKLHDVEGIHLFKSNVRIGIDSNSKENKLLRQSFENTFTSAVKQIYNKSDRYRKNANFTKELNEFLLNTFGLKDGYLSDKEVDCSSSTKRFWFKHNGVTIIEKKSDGININGNLVSIKSNLVQVINGAQTISKWSEIAYSANTFSEASSHNSQQLESLFKEVLSSLNVKCILITLDKSLDSSEINDIISDITIGLNTQVPVTSEEIFYSRNVDDKILEINKMLSSFRKSIIRSSEHADNVDSFTLRKFVQGFEIFNGKPGAARNMTLEYLTSTETLSTIIHRLNDKHFCEEFSNYLSLQNYLDSWWKKKDAFASIDDENFEELKALESNGNYLFKAYLRHRGYYTFVDQSIEELKSYYDEIIADFIVDFEEIIIPIEELKPISSNTFKGKDVKVFNNLINKSINDLKANTTHDLVAEDQAEYLDKPNKHKSSNYKRVKDYLAANNKNLENVRTITLKNEKVTESFPFTNSTFFDIGDYYDIYDNKQSDSSMSFKNSEFYKALTMEYNLFVFNEDQVNQYKIDFRDYLDEAEEVFYKTVDAFNNADEEQFIKASDNLKFHVRPKARTSEDVMKFSNGGFITKRTLWANKDTMNEIISNSVPTQVNL